MSGGRLESEPGIKVCMAHHDEEENFPADDEFPADRAGMQGNNLERANGRRAVFPCGGKDMARRYPREWLERVPAVVFASLIPGEFRIILHPGVGIADGGAPLDIPADLIPFELRIPNAPLWVQLDDDKNVLRVWRREDQQQGDPG
jgi:hypothetical protein